MSNLQSQIFNRRTPGWLLLLIVGLALLNGLPFLAPVFMKLGWQVAGSLVYLAYSPLCHQMAQRSFFLFGPQGFQMYNIDQLPVNASGPLAPLVLKEFAGNAQIGWKVAWSDRMVSMYGSPLIAAVAYAITRQFTRVKPLPLWVLVVFALPMALDGGTHFLSDFAGIGQGFRDNNAWLAVLSNHMLPQWFVSGDALGSFNSWMRLISGLTFGFGLGWFALPYMDEAGQELAAIKASAPSVASEEAAGADRPALL